MHGLYKAKNSSKFNFRGDAPINKSHDISGISRISSGKIFYLLDGAFCTTFKKKVVQNAPSKFI
jgi:hypothetical protein